MTDLEELADEIVEIATDESHHIFDLITGSKLRATVTAHLEAARTTGRIEGLEEASNLCVVTRNGQAYTTPDTNEVWQKIRARIQELEGEK